MDRVKILLRKFPEVRYENEVSFSSETNYAIAYYSHPGHGSWVLESGTFAFIFGIYTMLLRSHDTISEEYESLPSSMKKHTNVPFINCVFLELDGEGRPAKAFNGIQILNNQIYGGPDRGIVHLRDLCIAESIDEPFDLEL
jgi:hypothetical protein